MHGFVSIGSFLHQHCTYVLTFVNLSITALCKIQREAQIDTLTATLPITVVCDQIKDPATIGGIIRTAQSVGCSAVILVKGKLYIMYNKPVELI